MMAAVFRHHFGDLFGSRYSEVAEHAAVQCVRIIEVDDFTHKVGAIPLHEVVALAIGLAIQRADQERILLRTGLNLEAGDAPTIDRKSTRLNSSHLGISYAVF